MVAHIVSYEDPTGRSGQLPVLLNRFVLIPDALIAGTAGELSWVPVAASIRLDARSSDNPGPVGTCYGVALADWHAQMAPTGRTSILVDADMPTSAPAEEPEDSRKGGVRHPWVAEIQWDLDLGGHILRGAPWIGFRDRLRALAHMLLASIAFFFAVMWLVSGLYMDGWGEVFNGVFLLIATLVVKVRTDLHMLAWAKADPRMPMQRGMAYRLCQLTFLVLAGGALRILLTTG